ncbi:hypothetical protein GCM10009634_73980 [Saccharothrix xinjiangensis]
MTGCCRGGGRSGAHPVAEAADAVGGVRGDGGQVVGVERRLPDCRNPTFPSGSTALVHRNRQILAYIRLDTPDLHHIGSVGLHLARRGVLVAWSARTLAVALPGN